MRRGRCLRLGFRASQTRSSIDHSRLTNQE